MKQVLEHPLLFTSHCRLCPRNCEIDRNHRVGYCGCFSTVKAARAALHFWEEPCISGTKGSGAVFFSGCTLKCCFCQNHAISSGQIGKDLTPQRLGEIFLSLQEQGAHNINLITATHFLPQILPALELVKNRLTIPVVYNTSGYEKPEMIDLLKNYVDIWLPDLKYFDSALSLRYSKAKDYFAFAGPALIKMVQQCPSPVFDSQGILQKGVIIRHMVLPGCKEDSIRLLTWLQETLPKHSFLLSLLSQYTPFYKSSDYPEINRRITSYEYNKVLDTAIALGLTEGFMQKKSSAKEEYTPPFDLEGV